MADVWATAGYGGKLCPCQNSAVSLVLSFAMYYRDHAPPHFHAIYGDYEATININTGEVNGQLPKRALAHVQEWRLLHQVELRNAWSLAISQQPLPKIEPLE